MQNTTNISFGLKVKFQGEIIPAQCQVIEKHLYPQYRVVIVAESRKELVFVLYKTNHEGRLFFWFPLEGHKEALAQAIAKSLEMELRAATSN